MNSDYTNIRLVLVKAIKNLEHILIQAQKQKHNSSSHHQHKKENDDDDNNNVDKKEPNNDDNKDQKSNEHSEMNGIVDIKIKEEQMDTEIDEISRNGDPNTMPDGTPIKLEVDDIEMEDLTATEKEEAKRDKAAKIVDIDPKTYCTLGHYNLLLEDYAKGNKMGISFKCKFCNDLINSIFSTFSV